MSDYHTNTLKEALRRLRDNPFLPAAARHLMNNSSAINAELSKTILAEIPAFSESRNPDVLPDLSRYSPEHTIEILRLLTGGPVGDFEFVRQDARRRAEQRFPLEATLHAYVAVTRSFRAGYARQHWRPHLPMPMPSKLLLL